jgi:phosphoribosylformylglycinamidine synthase
VKFGILQFPGSCDEGDALQAARRVADAELLWHGERGSANPTTETASLCV